MAEYIDREALEVALNHRLSFLMAENSEYDNYTSGYDEAVDTVENFPSAADVAPLVHGQWEWFDEETGTPITGYEREWGWRCSRCTHELPDNYDNPDCRPVIDYCPYCGAKMDGGEYDG